MPVWKKICCPVDFSRESRVAMEEAAELAWRFGAQLTLVHVDDRPPLESDALASPEERDLQTAEIQRKLATWEAEAEPIATTTVGHALLAGGPADEITRFARDGEFDVIVMGTRGQTGRGGGEWCVGSVAEAVVREAHCAVVITRAGSAGAPRSRPPR